jgi:uncharacterized membrane protein/uncharacterized protein YegL
MDAFQLELARPWLLAALAILPLLAWYFHRSLVDFPRRQRMVSLALRSLIVVLLVLALAGLTLLAPTTRQFVVFVSDESLSIGDEATQAARKYIDEARQHIEGHEAALLRFAAEPEKLETDFDAAASPDAKVAKSKTPQADHDRGTNLAAAIDVAVASIPPFYVPKIVLLTDGNETEGDALLAAATAKVPIVTVPLPARAEPEVQVSSVSVPAQVRQGEPFYVEVVIDSNHDDAGSIDIFKGSLKLAAGEAKTHKIVKGENRFRFRQTIDTDRLAEFSVRIEGFQDTLLDNNAASGLVFTSGKPRVLLVDSDPKTVRDLVWALKEHDVLVETRPPEGLPDDLAGLQGFEALMISNVPATVLSTRQMEVIRAYVQDLGGGLVMLGGDQSFGLGGYYKSALEEILPVRSDFEKEKEKPSLAMVLVIDKSGSMGGQKIELAKQAAKSAVELLGPRDQVGVVAFDGNSYWVCEIHPASDSGTIMDRISTIQASGGTSMYPAMEMAGDALASTVAKLKHVILLTDGISSPGDFDGSAAKMASSRITLSTVGVGQGAHQEVLERIARLAGGRYYFCNDPQSVPQIFAKETVTASKSAIHEEPFLPQVVRPTAVLSEIDLEAAPFLLGYVATRPKPTCEFILASEKGEPILAWWRYGLGMSAAFTSDAKNRWAAEWTTWPDFGKFWAQIIRHVMRKSDAKGVFVDLTRRGSRAEVVLDAVDTVGQFVNQATTSLTVLDPQLGRQQITMAQVAPGRYKSTFATREAGTYHLELAQEAGGQSTFRQTRGLVVGYPEELRLRPTTQPLLTKIAEVSGGRCAAAASTIFEPDGRSVLRAEPLWPYLLSVVALLFVIDVALRRIDFSLLWPLRRSS